MFLIKKDDHIIAVYAHAEEGLREPFGFIIGHEYVGKGAPLMFIDKFSAYCCFGFIDGIPGYFQDNTDAWGVLFGRIIESARKERLFLQDDDGINEEVVDHVKKALIHHAVQGQIFIERKV